MASSKSSTEKESMYMTNMQDNQWEAGFEPDGHPGVLWMATY